MAQLMLRTAVLSALALSASALTPLRAETTLARMQATPMNISKWVATSPKIGVADEAKQVRIGLFLSLRNQAGLKALIAAQTNPRSPQYGKYLTPEAFRAAYSPAASDVAKVQDTMKSLGFTILSTTPNGLFVEASGTVAQIKSTFKVSQNLYAYQGKTLRANAETPSLPAAISKIVTFVAGLDDSKALLRPGARHIDDAAAPRAVSHASTTPSAPPPVASGIQSPFCSTYWGDTNATLSSAPGLYPQTMPWLLCGYTPKQIRQAYGASKVALDGTGVKVGIVDIYASPTIRQDANTYSLNYGLPRIGKNNFSQVIPKGLFDVPADDPCGPGGWYGEETLDVEAVHSMAPGATIVYGGIECTDPGNAALYGFIDNHTVDIITNSYSYNGEALPAGYITAENQYFMQAAAEGISVMFSTGDDGDLAAINGIASGTWDSTSPYVTAVGGTSLALINSNGAKQEWGWGTYRAYLDNALVSADGSTISTTGISTPFAFYSGAGGGPSLAYIAPDYQANVSYRLSGYTTLADKSLVPLGAPHRVTPDISLVGDPYTGFITGETYTKYGDPSVDGPCTSLSDTTEYCYYGTGGTSLSSPLFAGVLALVNQARFDAGKAAVGFVNPVLYTLPVGRPGTSASPIINVVAPTAPTSVLRGYSNDYTRVRVITINSKPNAVNTAIDEGYDTSLLAVGGYDNVTGLGTPNVPAMIDAFVALP